MPLDLDGAVSLSPAVAGSSGVKRAMLVKLTPEVMAALSSQLGHEDPKKQFPSLKFQFTGSPGLTVGDQFFAMSAMAERGIHELFVRPVTTPNPAKTMRLSGMVTGSFKVLHGTEVSERTRARLHEVQEQADQEKARRKTILIDSPIDPTTVAGRKRKPGADNALDRFAAVKESARPLAKSSSSAPASSSSLPLASTSRVAASREPPSRPISTQPGSRPVPKLNKSGATPAVRGRDGELTSNFRGGIMVKDTKPKKPAGAKGKAPIKEESSAEPDDLPLAITTKARLKTGAQAARPSLGATSSAPSQIKRETPVPATAVNGTGHKSRDSISSLPKSGAMVNGSSAPAPAPRQVARKQPADAAKRKRPTADDDEEYEGPGASKRRKTAAAGATANKAVNGKKPVAVKKEESASPPPASPPVVKLAKATDEPTLAKGLKFKKERKDVIPPPVPKQAPGPAAAPRPTLANGTMNGHSNSYSKPAAPQRNRKSTPTFTSTEDEGSEAEEGEVRPAKKQRKMPRPTPTSRPSNSHAAPWKPMDPLPTVHDALRFRYAETYAEYTNLNKTFATQRLLNMRQLEDVQGSGEWDVAETMDEDALLRLKERHVQVCEELKKIRLAFPESDSLSQTAA